MAADRIHLVAGQSLRGRARMAQSLCALAEAQLQSGRPALARETLRELCGAVTGINALLDCDTSCLPDGTVREIAELLADIDNRSADLEAKLGSTTIH